MFDLNEVIYIRYRNKLDLDRHLNKLDLNQVLNYIDSYQLSVSIHGNTVGKYVAKVANEVNKHHHTKTCRKHDTTCRFGYPRLPAPYTIIVEPCKADSPAKKYFLKIREATVKLQR